MQNRPTIYPQNIVRGAPVNANAKTQFSDVFPIGPGYYKTTLRLNIALTIGTGAGPISEGILNYLRQIHYRGDNGEVIVDNLPARPLYKIAQFKSGTAPRKDEIAAANGTYRIDIPIFHADPLAARPEDTVLDTSRYNSMTLDIVTGPLTDLFTAPGTASVVLTADIEVERSKFKWDGVKAAVIGFTSYLGRAPVDAASKTEIDIERASDLWYRRLFLHTATAGVSGQPWQGANSDAIIDYLSLTDSDDTFVQQRIWAMLQDDNKNKFSLEAVPSGVACLDFMPDGSFLSALWSNRNSLKLSWTNQAGVAANSFVTLVAEAYRSLRPPRDPVSG